LKAPQLIRKAGDLAIFARAIKGKALGWKGDRVVIADKEPRQKRQDGRGHPLRSSQQVAPTRRSELVVVGGAAPSSAATSRRPAAAPGVRSRRALRSHPRARGNTPLPLRPRFPARLLDVPLPCVTPGACVAGPPCGRRYGRGEDLNSRQARSGGDW